MRILGIDPGYERLGIAIVEKKDNKEILIHSECFQTSSKLPFNERLFLLGERVAEVIKKWGPDTFAIETLMFNTNQKTVMNVAEARGVVMYEAARGGLKIYEYTPLQIKIAMTGYGRSDKTQVTEMTKRLIKIDRPDAKDDEYDAIACALTCLASYRVAGSNTKAE